MENAVVKAKCTIAAQYGELTCYFYENYAC
jgi:hypothetical protein